MSLPAGLYGIADSGFGDPIALGEALLAGGARVVQLRCKGWSAERVARAARALAPRCRAAGVPMILNDHVALAHLGAGVHLGQGDGPVDRSVLPRGSLVGRSTHDLDQLAAAIAEGVDYVGFGPIHGTRTKPDALAPRGVEALARAVAASSVPVVAIGGLGPDTLDAVRATGAHGWAVISAILAAPDPVAAARGLSA